MARFTLSKQERLSSLKDIESLFTEGHSLIKYPFRLVWRQSPLPEDFPVRIMFSVSKKKFPRAVDRNRVKRLMRESYRLLKPDLFTAFPSDLTFHLGLIYTGNEILELESIQKRMAVALEQFTNKIREA